jgi:predicted molibdopterin-dependent oxidoreductase YjgC
MSIAKDKRRLGPLEARQPLTIQVDGDPVQVYAGESVATVLLALGLRTFRHTEHGTPRGLYCGMGVCFDCLVTVDGVENVRACMTPVAEGMVIATTSRAVTAGRATPPGRDETGSRSHD